MKSKLFTLFLFFLSWGLSAQTLWPLASDSAAIRNSQFLGGLNGWTTRGISFEGATADTNALWEWTSNGRATGAAYSSSTRVKSPTASNGAAIFNSDKLDNSGTIGNFGGGISPSPHASELISPNIDMTGKDNIVLSFYSTYRDYESQIYVSWSEDGGATWKPNRELFANFDRNDIDTSDVAQTIPLIGSKGSNQFRVKFTFSGDYYVWIIDDVQLTAGVVNDLKLDETFYAEAPNFAFPKSQPDSIAFLTDVKNNGNVAATNVKLIVNVYKDSFENKVFSDSLFYGTIAAGDTVQNKLGLKKYLPKKDEDGVYFIEYLVKGDSTEATPSDNRIVTFCLTTDTTFAKDDGPNVVYGYIFRTTDHSARYANYFYMPHGEGYKATSAQVGVFNVTDLKNKSFIVTLYKWKDQPTTESPRGDGICQSAERGDPIGFAEFIVPDTATTDVEVFNIALKNFNDETKPILLEDSTAYLIAVEFEKQNAREDSTDLLLLGSDYIDYETMNFQNRLDTNNKRINYCTFVGFTPDQSSALSLENWLPTYDYIPFIRLNIKSLSVPTEEVTYDQRQFQVFPNPVNGNLNIRLNFDKKPLDATLRLVNLAGQVVHEMKYRQISNDILQYNTSNLANGTYFLQLNTNEGTSTRKVMVQHQ